MTLQWQTYVTVRLPKPIEDITSRVNCNIEKGPVDTVGEGEGGRNKFLSCEAKK